MNYFWLEVEDEGGPWTPAVADPERGHGLDIMRTLADDWGIEGDHDGRTVWVPKSRSIRIAETNVGSPKGRES